MAHPELEFFILSTVVDHRLPLWTLEEEDEGLSMAVNRQVPEFTRHELIETLCALFWCGDLAAHLDSSNEPPFCPTRDEIYAALCGALHLAYALTPQGGARWEAMAQFNWDHYLGDWFDDGFDGPSRDMMEVYLDYDR